MDNTSLMFIKLHRDHFKTPPDEIFIDINKIIAISPNNNGGSDIYTVGQIAFLCKEPIDEVIKLIDEAFKNRLTERISQIK